MHSIESKFVKVNLLQDHEIYCWEACMCALFSPEILQAAAVKGLSDCSLKKKKKRRKKKEEDGFH